MKKLLLSVLTISCLGSINAQTSKTISTGSGYANDVYYKLSDDSETAVSRTNWDIALTTSTMGTTVRTNDGNNTTLYVYSTDINDWSTVDTNGFDWSSPLYNPDTTWADGAFSNFPTSGFDYGWGNYNMAAGHSVTANRIFLIELSDGSMQKMMIDSMPGTTANAGHLFFTYADVDGSNETQADITKADFSGKNFAYYSLQTNQELDREPANTDWDLLFTKYMTDLGGGLMYSVTGVLSNDLNIVQVNGVDVSSSVFTDGDWDSKINVIGNDWKGIPGPPTYQYPIKADTSFFVEDVEGDIYKLVFTAFGGSSTGEYEFTKELVSGASVETNEIEMIGAYPNPASDWVTLTYKGNGEQINCQIMTITGQVLRSEFFGSALGLQQSEMNVSDLQSGVYLVNLIQGSKIITQKLVIQ